MKESRFKPFILLSIVSVVILLLPIRLGGAPFGHNYKFVAVAILYSGAAFLAFRYFSKSRERLIASIILLLPVFLLYVPMHWLYAEAALLSLPSTLSHMIGFAVGIFLDSVRRSLLYSTLGFAAFIVFLIWSSSAGYALWINRLNYGSFTSDVHERIPDFQLFSEGNDAAFSTSDLRNKIVVFDFWTTNCGICFKKFPILDGLHQKYRGDAELLFFSVNIPLTRENENTKNKALNHIRSNYKFKTLLASSPSLADTFNVVAYPTVLIFNGGEIVYRGDIENVDEIISKLRTNDAYKSKY